MVTAGELLQLVLTILVPLVPLGFRQYFIQEAEKGISKLRFPTEFEKENTLRIPDEDFPSNPFTGHYNPIDQNILSRGEPGFDQIEDTIRDQGRLSGEAKRFGLAMGDLERLGVYLDLSLPALPHTMNNAVLYVDYTTGDTEVLLYHPLDYYRTARLVELDQWVRYAARKRSEWLTIFFAFLLFGTTILI
ncbi:hypothetical protein [Halococcus agarilyticus]|uniref:hypothetical protein n=1 Tax=Halococcus agarilyticus TaxID=1232219 RepID=UPI00067781F1|nr:hypothetical protein [Halococcus agarilyticus]